MKRYILMLLILLLAISPAFAAVGYKNSGSDAGQITDLDIYGGSPTFDGRTLKLNIAGPNAGGEGAVASGVWVIPVSYSTVIIAASDGDTGHAMTLANGTKGQILNISLAARTGSETFVITPATVTGYATITLDAALEYVTLLYVDDTIGWIILGANATIA